MDWNSFFIGGIVGYWLFGIQFFYWHMSGFVLTRLRNRPDPTWVGGIGMCIRAKTWPRPAPTTSTPTSATPPGSAAAAPDAPESPSAAGRTPARSGDPTGTASPGPEPT